VIDMHTIKPLDRDAIAKAARETGAMVVSEEHWSTADWACAWRRWSRRRIPWRWNSSGFTTPMRNRVRPKLFSKIRLDRARCRRSRAASAETEAPVMKREAAGQTLHDDIGPLLSAAGPASSVDRHRLSEDCQADG
jgi:hypothetical protein